MGRLRTEQQIKEKIAIIRGGLPYHSIQDAWLGKDKDTAPTSGCPDGYIWVRIGSEKATPVQAVNKRVNDTVPNIKVRVGVSRAGRPEVIEVHDDEVLSNPQWAGHLNQPRRRPEGLYDEPVYPERITNLRMYAVSGLMLGVMPGLYIYNGAVVAFEGGTIDLTSDVPGTANKKCITLIGIDLATNALTSDAQTAVDIFEAPRDGKLFALSDYITALNSAATDTHWIGALPLVNGQAHVQWLYQYQTFTHINHRISGEYVARSGDTMTGHLTLDEGVNIVAGTTTGNKLGTSASQKLGFYGAAPVVQPTFAISPLTEITHTGPTVADYAIGTPVDSSVGSAWGYSSQDELETVLSVIKRLQQEVADLKSVITTLGLGA